MSNKCSPEILTKLSEIDNTLKQMNSTLDNEFIMIKQTIQSKPAEFDLFLKTLNSQDIRNLGNNINDKKRIIISSIPEELTKINEKITVELTKLTNKITDKIGGRNRKTRRLKQRKTMRKNLHKKRTYKRK